MSRAALRIAVVDDEESVCKALQRLLRAHLIEGFTFSNAAEFLSSVTLLAPDCVVLDLHMPEISGFEVLDLLPPELPVVAMTGHDSPEAYARARRAGAYLRKPVDEKTLLEAIDTAIRVASL